MSDQKQIEILIRVFRAAAIAKDLDLQCRCADELRQFGLDVRTLNIGNRNKDVRRDVREPAL